MTSANLAALNSRQTILAAILGVTLWFVAALMIRYLAPMGALDGMNRALTFALIIPGTWPFVLLMRKFAGLAKSQTGLGMAVGTAAAMLCDGLALSWFPSLYGDSVEIIAGAGATILWGAAVGIVLGFLMSGGE